jgi:hypothetical protein
LRGQATAWAVGMAFRVGAVEPGIARWDEPLSGTGLRRALLRRQLLQARSTGHKARREAQSKLGRGPLALEVVKMD